jgi:hypothetical protein
MLPTHVMIRETRSDNLTMLYTLLSYDELPKRHPMPLVIVMENRTTPRACTFLLLPDILNTIVSYPFLVAFHLCVVLAV